MCLVAGRAIISAAVLVFVMRESDSEIRNEFFPSCRGPKRFAKTRKWKARRISRARFDVAIRADARRRSLACKELRPMTGDAGLVLGKLRDIRKSVALFAHGFPVWRGKFMTGLTLETVLRVGV